MEIPTEPDKRLVYFDYLQEQGKKLGFIRTIPNITKFTKEVFEQVVSDEMFFFDVKESIPIYDWEWEGVVIPKERIVSRDDSINVFKLSTIIGNYRITQFWKKNNVLFKVTVDSSRVTFNTNTKVRKMQTLHSVPDPENEICRTGKERDPDRPGWCYREG